MFWNKGNGEFSNKKDEIELKIAKYAPIIFGILEVHMAVNAYLPALQISGYSLERDNLIQNGIRTRTAMYISDRINYIRRHDLEVKNSPMIWIEVITNPAKPWLLFLGYRQWRQLEAKNENKSRNMLNQKIRFQQWLGSWEMANNEGKQIILIGDMNIDVGPWLNPEIPLTEYQQSKSQLLSLIKTKTTQLNMELIRTKPTRYQGINVPSTLDVIFSNFPHLIIDHQLIEASSDHKIVLFQKAVNIKPKLQLINKMRSYKAYSKLGLVQKLDMPLLNSLLENNDADTIAETMVEEINRVLDLVAPIKTIQLRTNYAPHLTIDTKNVMKKRYILKTKANVSKN